MICCSQHFMLAAGITEEGYAQSSGGENGNPLQHSCLKNPMNREAWWAIVHGVVKSWTRLIN